MERADWRAGVSSWLRVDPTELVGALLLAGLGLVLAIAVWTGGDTAVATSDGPVAVVATTSEAPDTVIVHVSGAVRTPGLAHLVDGDRVADAVAAAGGPLPGADLSAVNLARPVVDGEQVHVPVVGEQPASGSAGGAVLGDGRVDVNRATAAELETLPGVGPVLAQRIVAHREEHGPFASPDDLRDVSGIGERTLETLADLVVTP